MEESSRLKRPQFSTGNTPNKPPKKREKTNTNTTIRKPLFSTPSKGSPKRKTAVLHTVSPVKYHQWTQEEERSLIEFIALAKTDTTYNWPEVAVEWPSFRVSHAIWDDAAKHIQEATSSNFILTGQRIRGRLLNVIKRKFKSLTEAEEFYGLTLSYYLEDLNLNESAKKKKNTHVDQRDKCTQTKNENNPITVTEIPTKETLLEQAERLSHNSLLEVTNNLFLKLATAKGLTDNPGNFVSLSLDAMVRLKQNDTSNLLYKLAHSLACNRPGTNEPLLPMDRMPFGLIAYQIEFFSCTHTNQIRVPTDFAVWYETMCSEFPTRFHRLFRGPMWSSLPPQDYNYPLKARVNVAAPSLQWIERRTKASEYTEKPDLQISALINLKNANPKGRFWIKADATDVKPALQESVHGEWNGDICLDENVVQNLKQTYDSRTKLMDVKSVEANELNDVISLIITDLKSDIVFLMTGLQNADELYLKKFNCPTTSKEKLKELCWERVEYNTLIQQAQSFQATMEQLLVILINESTRNKDVAACLKNVRMDFLKYLKNVFVKKRQPAATHILVFLLSDEKRVKKPYALPIQYIPYESVRDQYIRDMTSIIKTAMVQNGMKAVGTVTDGEFSSLRTQGETRPLHIIQLIHDAKECVKKQSKNTLLSMLVRVGEDANGRPIVQTPNKHIPDELINELYSLRVQQHMTLEDAITYLRGKLVPPGFVPYTFRPDTPESLLDKLRSLVGTYVYRGTIDEYQTAGIPFKQHFYCPEIDPITGDLFHEREDHCHILKRIAKHTREGGNPKLNLKGFDDAMLDPGTGLTQAALTGERKQSVQDAERLLSYNVARFLRQNGYVEEAEYVSIVAGWHEAADGRGLSELERCRKNYAMLNMILDDWMPWHNTMYDLSTIDINRPIKGICGFSRETVIAVTGNIDSMELRRCQSLDIGYGEHPRAGSTDDVEAFFALVHRFLGNVFTLKQFKYEWRKLVREFCKRMNSDLPFYYWTLNERFADLQDELPSFNSKPDDDDDDDDDNNDPQQHPLRLHRLTINRREDSSVFVSGRCFLPVRNHTTIRQRLFRPNACLPAVQPRDNV